MKTREEARDLAEKVRAWKAESYVQAARELAEFVLSLKDEPAREDLDEEIW